MSALTGFPPLAKPNAVLLILGSMPGVESLRQSRYYAHPRNAFWPIMGALFGAAPELPYSERTRKLTSSRVAVWDVLKHCRRPGSLDSNISPQSMVSNDFVRFFAKHAKIKTVFFNGRKAEETFHRHVLDNLGTLADDLSLHRLPSTSPAYASLTLQQKLAAWQCVRAAVDSADIR